MKLKHSTSRQFIVIVLLVVVIIAGAVGAWWWADEGRGNTAVGNIRPKTTV